MMSENESAIISLPHEIQRNLTLLKEHDSKVQEINSTLYKDIDEFMLIQSQSKSVSTEESNELIKRIKTAFLQTLTHSEEKVSLSSQCYTTVEKHLIKLEDDLKCFEEEINLSGYPELLAKIQQQERERRLREKSVNVEEREGSSNNNNTRKDVIPNGTTRSRRTSSREPTSAAATSSSSRRSASGNSEKKTRRGNITEEDLLDGELDEMEAEAEEIAGISRGNKRIASRAERLIRRSRPTTQQEQEQEQEQERNDTAAESQNNATENQGDDESEEFRDGSDESEEFRDGSEEEEGGSEEVEEDMDADADEDMENKRSEAEDSDDVDEEDEDDDDDEEVYDKTTTTTTTATANLVQPPQPKASTSTTEPVYCFCQRPSYGQMVACDGKSCDKEWFHYPCVGLKSLPKGKWYCKECQEKLDARTAAAVAAASASGMSTRSSRRQI